MAIRLLPSQRTLRRNIWTGVLHASEQEIRDGIDFYPGAHGLCRMFARIFDTTPEHVAGLYAALSPMNGWDTNVANVLDVLRWRRATDLEELSLGALPSVNTTGPNRDKAVRIALGEDPLDVLRGRKVRAFYTAIADPSNLLPIPVDRHLICLALGRKLGKNELSRAASDKALYSAVDTAYTELGRRESLGNRLAAIAWFVQRRMDAQGQVSLHDSPLVCCGSAMRADGQTWTRKGVLAGRRYQCRGCGRRTIPRAGQQDSGTAVPVLPAGVQVDSPLLPLPGRVWIGRAGWPLINLGIGHPLANSGGWQYLARYVAGVVGGGRLRTDEEVHHVGGDKLDCRIDSLKVMLKETHGRHHARHQLLYMLRDVATGRFVESSVPSFDGQLADLKTWNNWQNGVEVPF